MKINVISVLALATFALSGVSFASGFKCDSADYSAKIFNNVDPLNGTRTPAALVISSLDKGTLLVRRGTEIRKHNRLNTVQYVVEGSRKADADTAILQISFKEGGEVLEAGDTADGQLILVKDGERTVTELVCTRYLKNS